jgi:hypothetical protein
MPSGNPKEPTLSVNGSRRVARQFIQVDSIPHKNLTPIKSVDGAQGIQAIERGDGASVFDVCQTAQSDKKLIVAILCGDPAASLFHVPILQPKFFTSLSQLLTGFWSRLERL